MIFEGDSSNARKAPSKKKSARQRGGSRGDDAGSGPPTLPSASETPTGARRSRLGTKWSCYGCGSKFYDMNAAEPLCPKCGADQRERPKEEKLPEPPPEPRERSRAAPSPLYGLEDEDDAATTRDLTYADDLEIGLGAIDDEEDEDRSLEEVEDEL